MNRLYATILAITCLLTSVAARAQTGQTITGSITVGGLVRDYRLYVPAAYQAGHAVPLLLNLHGYGSNNQQQELYGDFRAIADTANFLVLHPNGTLDSYGYRTWNTFTAPGSGGPDDVAFLSALLTAIGQQYTLDPDRLYCTGLSNGGFMSYELACHLGTRIAAIASVAGSIATTRLGTCTPAHPTPVLEIHGDADGTVPYLGNALFTPVPDVLTYWVTANSCVATPVVTAVPDTDPTDGCTATRSVWRGSQAGAVVEHLRIIGGGHTWPGASVNIGVTNRDLDASKEIWRFLRRYRLSRLALAAVPAAVPVALRVYPNPAAGAATFAFTLAQPARTAITLYNLAGTRCASILPETTLAVGSHAITYASGSLPAGLYFYMVLAGSQVYMGKLVLE
ncbi:MAG: extracellular catalytic domain type 1 short-chain-length polyhydroxyalkanoate depolymerase [Janthinobacterium lividum]